MQTLSSVRWLETVMYSGKGMIWRRSDCSVFLDTIQVLTTLYQQEICLAFDEVFFSLISLLIYFVSSYFSCPPSCLLLSFSFLLLPLYLYSLSFFVFTSSYPLPSRIHLFFRLFFFVLFLFPSFTCIPGPHSFASLKGLCWIESRTLDFEICGSSAELTFLIVTEFHIILRVTF
jgi:hypothetical protein